ncbi:ATP-dependent DNA helicase RecG [Akkermansiaceae bacterium]|nr:ATP-dependent DNA helicase RecG [Akkermansiaceae bacterium]MDA7540672.1 ATP-dependent DNA helicase RecG [bacterium]MDA7639162.1 ATP-dependent DNA helicase RecG [Akkermansiaceae bacterium]MDA7678229.1 ATP-dependent DNA helicase RecG [Akkermansiaceae bacterium]MDA7927306.1 ATP-dependent DNA helicase RecG [Akkermansiaceae bacterium]
MKMNANDSLQSLSGIRAQEVEALRVAGIERFSDLIDWLPKRYEDRRRFDAFPAQAGGGSVCLRGLVIDTQRKGFGGKGFYEAVVEDHAGGGFSQVTCRWFKMPFLHKIIAAGHEVVLYGKPKESGGKVVIDHPEFEVVSEEGRSVHLERIVPIYKNVSGVPQRKLREVIFRVLEVIDGDSLIPVYDIDPSYPRIEAFREVHFPGELKESDAARRYFAKEEFFLQQLRVVWRRARHADLSGRILGKRTLLLTEFYNSLPFDLTNAQKRSVKEIIRDMRVQRPMNRLLQGDVGSGKTFVAMCAMLLAVDSGCQAVLMAPTQILAEQHHLTFSKWLSPLGVKVGLATADRREDVSAAPIIVGTHALLYDKVDFDDLGLIVIDEQHKFGVAQREKLIHRGVMPDVLVMTATPIPRTLTLTIYGDLDVSILDELPAGRGKIISGVRVKPKITEMTNFLIGQLEEGRQAYLVYPLVDESKSIKAASAVEEHPKWQKRFKHFEVELLHGKMPSEEKEAVMTRFRDGKTEVLVSTTVIEVGVDVPNANVMVIFNAERFGLAQLHQLRGRIGRGEHKSYCVLITDGKNPEAIEKLNILAGTVDGFKIAEEDLRMRGPGEVLGTRQSGTGGLRFVEFLSDTSIIREAREVAEKLLSEDPSLKQNVHLKTWLLGQTEVTNQ